MSDHQRPPAIKPGTRLGRYRVVSPLGAGGMGEVYRARDERLDRDVAVKVLPPTLAGDAGMLARLQREARALARLSHPNILAIHDFGSDGGTAYAVTELLEGSTLRDLVTGGPVSGQRAAALGQAIADGLAAAHAHGVIHRDLKPENVFITAAGTVKILDFGLARMKSPAPGSRDTGLAATELATIPGTVLGTVGYMAPEQVRGEPSDARSDVFSLGCVLHELVTGKPIFQRRSALETMMAVLTDAAPPIPVDRAGVSHELVNIITLCLEKEPSARFQSASELATALASIGRGEGPASRPAGLPPVASAVGPAPEAGTQVLAPVPPSEQRQSVAVLDFVNLSRNPADDWLSQGIGETVSVDLRKVSALTIVPRSQVLLATAGAPIDVMDEAGMAALGWRIGAGWVVVGAFQKAGQAIRITARFIDTTRAEAIETVKLDGSMAEVFALQDDIVKALAGILRVSVDASELRGIEKPETDNLKAYEHCARARQLINEMRQELFFQARDHLRRAIELDPDYALAHSLLGHALAMAYIGTTDLLFLDQAIKSLERAVQLDPGLADPHVWLAYSYARKNRFKEAIASGRRAVSLEPDSSLAHYMLAAALWLRSISGVDSPAWADAVRHLRRAAELAPRSQVTHMMLADILMRHGLYDAAAPMVATALEIETSGERELARFVGARALFASLHLRQNRLDDALAAYESSLTFLADTPHVYQASFQGLCLCGRGEILLRLNRGADALASFRAATTLVEANPRAIGIGWVTIRASTGMARVFQSLGMSRERDRATEAAESLLASRQGFDFSGIFDAGPAEACFELACCHGAARRAEPALAWFERAIQAGWRESPRVESAIELRAGTESQKLAELVARIPPPTLAG